MLTHYKQHDTVCQEAKKNPFMSFLLFKELYALEALLFMCEEIIPLTLTKVNKRKVSG